MSVVSVQGTASIQNFCAAVDIMQERAKECGATTILYGLKVHLSPSESKDVDNCISFANSFLTTLNEKGVCA